MIYVGFWKRKTAYAIDIVLVLILYFIVVWLMGDSAYAQSSAEMEMLQNLGLSTANLDPNTQVLLQSLNAGGQGGGLATLPSAREVFMGLGLSLAVSAIYNIGFVASRWQTTPGKYLCGIKIVTCTGEHPGLLRATARHAASGLSMLPLGLGYLTMAFSSEKAALHDLICGTRVVRV